MATAIDYTRKLKPESRALVFNPGGRKEHQLGGETFHFPASTERYIDLLRELGKDARLSRDEQARLEALPPGIRPMTDMIVSKNGTENPQRGKHDVIPFRTEEQLAILLGDSGRHGKLGEWGLRILFEDENDAAIIKEAKSAYEKKVRAHALARVAAHRAQMAKYAEAGMPAPPPTEELLELYRVEAQTRRGGQSGKVCDICGFSLESDAELKAHKSEFHAVEESAASVPEPVKRGPGRPRKVSETPDA
jgi:hypothetical protein